MDLVNDALVVGHSAKKKCMCFGEVCLPIIALLACLELGKSALDVFHLGVLEVSQSLVYDAYRSCYLIVLSHCS